MLKNITKNSIIDENPRIYSSVLSQARGLMFSLKPRTLIFPFRKSKRISLHMWFVFFPIDVVFLNEQREVVEVLHSFRPFRWYTSKEKAWYAIELPQGTIARANIEPHDQLEF